MNVFSKDPDAFLDYLFDWTAWLDTDETIISHDVEVPAGITLDNATRTTAKVTAWLRDGTVGVTYPVTCHIVTNQGREDDRTIRVAVRER